METELINNFFIIILGALTGGVLARLFKLPVLVGYIGAGLLGGLVLTRDLTGIHALAEIGLILLLFSVGLELSIKKLLHTGTVSVLGAIIQMIIVTALTYLLLSSSSVPPREAFVLASGFSLSSTALVVKMLEDRAEIDAMHGKIMVGWLLTQDLAVIPILAVVPALVSQGSIFSEISISLATSAVVVILVIALGRLIAPFIIHLVAETNSRELLVLSGITTALGTALLVSLFGVSAALGAFLAGVAISETQENHAIFSETRSLRDIFVIIFFVTLGFFIDPGVLFSNFPLIILLSILIMLLKLIVVYTILYLFNYRGRTSLISALGLTQIGEFSFVVFLQANSLGVLSQKYTSIGIASTLITLIATPFIFMSTARLWRRLKKIEFFAKSGHREHTRKKDLENHIIICGFGRMGRWIGKALEAVSIPFIVIDYSKSIVNSLRQKDTPVIYGDPSDIDVLKVANAAKAKAVIIAIPDRVVQEEVILHTKKLNEKAVIIARGHLDEDIKFLSALKVDKVVQPEFEGALSAVREMLRKIGKNKEVINKKLKLLRRFHTMDY